MEGDGELAEGVRRNALRGKDAIETMSMNVLGQAVGWDDDFCSYYKVNSA